MRISISIKGFGFIWSLWEYDLMTVGPALVIFNLYFYRKSQPVRGWKLSIEDYSGIQYTDIKDGKMSRWSLQSPIHFERISI